MAARRVYGDLSGPCGFPARVRFCARKREAFETILRNNIGRTRFGHILRFDVAEKCISNFCRSTSLTHMQLFLYAKKEILKIKGASPGSAESSKRIQSYATNYEFILGCKRNSSSNVRLNFFKILFQFSVLLTLGLLTKVYFLNLRVCWGYLKNYQIDETSRNYSFVTCNILKRNFRRIG